MCRPVEVLLPSFVLFTFVRNVELGGVCVFIGWRPLYFFSTCVDQSKYCCRVLFCLLSSGMWNWEVCVHWLAAIYSPSTSFSFCLKMFFNSPRVDSIFSRENWFSPSTVLSLATQELSSVTVVSSRVHSFSRVSTFLTQSSDTALTLLYFSLRAATSLSASSWVVIFLEADSAATSTAK